VTASQLRRLETQLSAAEQNFLAGSVYGQTAEEIRPELDTLLMKITTERLRAEEREQSTTESSEPRSSLLGNNGTNEGRT
jgi:hypothetical protein